MGFVRYWREVARLALRHSVDITQAVLFLAGLAIGVASQLVPAIKAMVLGVNGWQVAAIVLGVIVFGRLFVLGPYWYWKEQNARVEELEESARRRAAMRDPSESARRRLARAALEDRRELAGRVSEIVNDTMSHPGGSTSFTIFSEAVALRDRFMVYEDFKVLWNAFQNAVLAYLLGVHPVSVGFSEPKAQREALAHELEFRPPIDKAAHELTKYLLMQDDV